MAKLSRSKSYLSTFFNDGIRFASRHVFFNIPFPSAAKDKFGVPLHLYKNNKLRTSKYTLLTFIPQNLYEQFHRVANLFFLFMVTIQAFPVFGVVNPVFAAMPLTSIITITAIKDAYEDFKRHREDNEVNNTNAYILDDWENTNYPRYHIPFFRKLKTKLSKKFRWIMPRKCHPKRLKIIKEKNSDINIEALKDNDNDTKMNGMEEKKNLINNNKETKIDFNIKPNKNIGWKATPWKDLRVGDIILLSINENVPADIVILSTSEEENECYVETKNLDGETTLKRRSGKKETQCIRDPETAKNMKFVIKAENPSVNLYEFRSRIELPDLMDDEYDDDENNNNDDNNNNNNDNDTYNNEENEYTYYSGSQSEDDVQSIKEDEEIFPNGKISIPLDITNLLLRGSVIRNTEWVIGAVIYTGEDTKVRLNSGTTPSKRSRIEKLMNPQVVFNFLILFIISFAVSCINLRIVETWDRNETPFFILRHRKMYRKFLETFGSTMIMMQNVVPISLYISIEIAKTIQAWFIHEDVDLYYEETDSPCNTKTWNISDDLGQIEYIFSDKTGTLTQNKMDFMRCSIIGKIYGRGYTDVTRDIEGFTIEETQEMEREMEYRMKDLLFSYYNNPYVDKSTKFSFLDDQILFDIGNENTLQGKAVFFFFKHLALCHSVLSPRNVVLEDGTETTYLEYCAESPDEQALVTTAKNLGFTFVRRTENSITINCFGKEETYEILHVLEFNSVRKRMSVILRTPKQEVLLLCKGADTVIYERLQKNQDNLRNVTFSHLEKFGSEGLRTLCIAYRYINAKDYQKWSEDYHNAEISLENRDELKDELASNIERNLILLGATAIEDKLQEGVPECIGILRDAGIKLWVLTGDKLETAINIGFASNLLNRSMCLLAIRERNNLDKGDKDNINDVQTQLRNAYTIINKYGNIKDRHKPRGRNSIWFFANIMMNIIELLKHRLSRKAEEEDLKTNEIEFSKFQSLHKSKRRSNMSSFSISSGKSVNNVLMGKQVPSKDIDFALIVDGQSLQIILEKPNLRNRFLETATNCRAVICCRVSPKQKSQVVSLVKNGLKVLCLSIGDGANDISMIQEANIGVGIAGQEGMQAAMSSDYAISQFRFLSKLVIVHGRWSYYRISNMVMNFFYKNIVWVFTLFWYQFSCGFSAQILFDYSLIMFFNFIFSSLPVMVMGIFDKDLKKETLLNKPPLYETMGIAQKRFTWKRFLSYVADALYQSYICFYIPYFTFVNTSFSDGLTTDLYYYGCIISCYVITLANLCVAVNMKSINWLSGVVLIVEVFSFSLYFVIYAHLPFIKFYKEYIKLMVTDLRFYTLYIIIIVVALFPRMVIKFVNAAFIPDDSDIYREIEKYHLADEDDDYIYDYTDELDQKMNNNIPPKYSNNLNINEDSNKSNSLRRYNSIENEINSKKSSTFKDNIYNSFKLSKPKYNIINNNGTNITSTPLEVKRLNQDNDSSLNQNVTNLDQLIQIDDNMDGSFIANIDNNIIPDNNINKGNLTINTNNKILIDEEDRSLLNAPGNQVVIHTPVSSIPGTLLTNNSNFSLDIRNKTMSIRSARSRRNNLLRQGTSADGQAMSVIFMDNNEEYVNTGFAFAYNDENEMSRYTRKSNPLFKAKSVDEIYERRRNRRHNKLQRKASTYIVRRQSQPDTTSASYLYR
ncbi:phospholipid-translocating P-type ATPase [Anaeromyces robustus]|uniref:Phospholipid-transporting ATPase n=1 Tax=Anaeromyces robustus TaxID=1754192 RepID=A0A1Y1X5Z2_9FUNG|nr:phospholipid-translocating P-type ATPase [Anaeromyces robustus]|eukprot:ORX81203.1 phospholipid-translocating P-type ATPase [Anaeromyces robustus]